MDESSLLGRSQEIIQESRELKDFSRFKIAVIGILGIASAFGAGYFLSVVDLFLGTALALIFVIIFTLQAFFVNGKGTLALLILLEAVALGAPFYRIPTLYYGLLVFILFVMLYLGSLSGIRELDNAFKVPFFKIARIVLVSSMTALALFVGSLYMGFGGAGYLSDTQIKSFIGLNVDPVIKMFIPTYTSKTSVEKLLTQVVLKQLPPSQQDQLVAPVIGKLAKDIESFVGVPLSLTNTLSDAIFKVANSRISRLESDAKIVLAIVLFIAAWFFAKSAAAIVYYPVVIFTYFVYEILFMTGFVYLQLETRNREVIVLK